MLIYLLIHIIVHSYEKVLLFQGPLHLLPIVPAPLLQLLPMLALRQLLLQLFVRLRQLREDHVDDTLVDHEDEKLQEALLVFVEVDLFEKLVQVVISLFLDILKDHEHEIVQSICFDILETELLIQ